MLEKISGGNENLMIHFEVMRELVAFTSKHSKRLCPRAPDV